MYKILVVDDESNIRDIIKKYANFEGHVVYEASNGIEGVDACRKYPVDIVVMDIMMPYLDGFSAVREIRTFSKVPIIMLSARGEEYDKINSFVFGVDDYVVKPFSPKELMLRINAIMSRVSPKRNESDVLRREGLEIDLTARKVISDGRELNLSPKEYDLLFYLAQNRNVALSREKLITGVWGYDYYGDDRTLDTHIKLLRRSLGVYGKFIVTLRGVGYRFDF